ncbi:MAG TPA: alpha-ketoacid dehydrogenase subunit beta [Dehalococcoidia bacterium]|nr:alpha-ketoacid dehydrogenase subunit beta [Dehalococcoidia bacterium]
MPVITYREALNQALREEMRRDKRVFVMGEDVADYGGSYAVTKGLPEEFGDRVRDTPISESAIVGAAVGAAMGGLRPIAEIMTVNFTLVAMDQIVNQAAKLHYMFGGTVDVPLVIRTATSWGQLAATHSQTFDSWLAHIPGLKVVVPATPYDAKGLLKTSVRDPDPVIFIEHTLLYGVRGEVPDHEYTVPIGVSDVKRAGQHCTVVTWGRMVHVVMNAAQQLAQEHGIEVEVIDLRSIRPLDLEPVIRSFQKTSYAVVVEEGWPVVSLGAEIACQIYEHAFDYLNAPIVRLAAADVPVPYAKNLERLAIPHEGDVVDAVRSLVRPRRARAAAGV